MLINLANPAVAFLFFGTFALWTFFVGWAVDEAQDWAQWVAVFTAASSGLVALIALFVIVTNAL